MILFYLFIFYFIFFLDFIYLVYFHNLYPSSDDKTVQKSFGPQRPE
jgi:hypothetical protein